MECFPYLDVTNLDKRLVKRLLTDLSVLYDMDGDKFVHFERMLNNKPSEGKIYLGLVCSAPSRKAEVYLSYGTAFFNKQCKDFNSFLERVKSQNTKERKARLESYQREEKNLRKRVSSLEKMIEELKKSLKEE